MGILHITSAVYTALRAHGEETYPHECCGALLGRSTPGGLQVEAAVRAGNTRTDSAHNRYSIARSNWSKSSAKRGARALQSPASTTPTPTTPRNGRLPTLLKPTGWAAPTSLPPSPKATPP